MLNESNFEEDYDINHKIILVLNTEIQRLSEKDQSINKSSHSTVAHLRSKTKLKKTHHRVQLVFTSTQIEDEQNKEDASTTFSEQAYMNENSFFTADHTLFT